MDSVFLSNEEPSRFQLQRNNNNNSNIPTWKIPLSKTYSSGLKSLLYQDEDIPDQEKEIIPKDKDSFIRSSSFDESSQTVIQILLPCIICNRTFSPEALERHSKICVRVRTKDNHQPRPTFDSAVQRIKGTKVADFIPPPDYLRIEEPSCFTRNSRTRTSFQGSPTRSSFGKGSNSAAPWRRQRASSTPKTFSNSDNYAVNPGSGYPDDHDQEQEDDDTGNQLPSYARALSPTEDCPYCLRSFGLKAYDRHVKFCQEVWERKQYEIQPTPAELEEARERQDIRTKYKPMKGSNSCSSLRSVSPPRKLNDQSSRSFASAALHKLFGGLKRAENRTLYRTPDRIKKSNESLTSSCYGDFARSMSIRGPPSLLRPDNNHEHNNRFGFVEKNHPMQINNSSNVQKKTKSTDSLSVGNSVPSSGYGPGGSYLNNFSRNSRTRSSLNNNHSFFRSKRVEPEGTENTNCASSNNSATNNALIITPMNFYTKQRSEHNDQQHHDSQNKSSSIFNNSDPKYDPYEKAAKQLEELLRTQPLLHKSSKSNRTQRRIGIDRAFASVNPLGSMLSNDNDHANDNGTSNDYRNKGIRNGFQNGKNSSKSINLEPSQYISSPTHNFSNNSNTEDSYWEEILDKKSRSRDEQDSKDRQRDHRDSVQLSDSSELNSVGNSLDTQLQQHQKSRAVSNISSADSAFSRSDGTDLEFEALESLVTKSLGNVPLTSLSNSKTSELSDSSKSSDLLYSRHPPMMMTSFMSKPVSVSPENSKANINMTDSNVNVGLIPTAAKFCHECGTCYPTTAAKFCPECGERRVINV